MRHRAPRHGHALRSFVAAAIAYVGMTDVGASPASAEGAMVAGDGFCAGARDTSLANDWSGTLSFDNDKLGGAETDGSYTSGLRLVFSQVGFAGQGTGSQEGADDRETAEAGRPSRILTFLREGTQGLQKAIWEPLGFLSDNESPAGYRHSFGGGFSIFTPESTRLETVPADERPYGSSFYLLYGLEQEYCDEKPGGQFLLSNRYVSNIEYQVGWIGRQPGEAIIEGFHSVWPAGGHTAGWESRHINYEPMLNIFYNRIWSGIPFPRFIKPNPKGILGRTEPWTYEPLDLGIHFRPHAGFALGNVYTYGNAGVTVRAGFHLPEDVGPPTIRPASPGSDYFRSRHKRCPYKPHEWSLRGQHAPFAAYAFAGLESRGVLYNAFLDGNMFSESPSVDKETFVHDRYVGAAIEFGDLRLTYSRVYRSPEFDGQGDTVFGAVTLGINIDLHAPDPRSCPKTD